MQKLGGAIQERQGNPPERKLHRNKASNRKNVSTLFLRVRLSFLQKISIPSHFFDNLMLTTMSPCQSKHTLSNRSLTVVGNFQQSEMLAETGLTFSSVRNEDCLNRNGDLSRDVPLYSQSLIQGGALELVVCRPPSSPIFPHKCSERSGKKSLKKVSQKITERGEQSAYIGAHS